MAGRNSHPDRDGQRSTPSRLDQFGETLANNDNIEQSLTSSQEEVAFGNRDEKNQE